MGKSPSGFPRDSWDFVGGLSSPSKMPGYAYSLPASRCIVGSQLASIPGSVCSGCYALRGRYNFPNVQRAMHRRLAAISTPGWAHHMAILINAAHSNGDIYFRWHDSGDLQGEDHLGKIVEVAMATPGVQHWLPTRETAIVQKFLHAGRNLPSHPPVRLSTHMIDDPPPSGISLPYVTSTVHTNAQMSGSYFCPARNENNTCGNCRACWDRRIQNVSYPKH